MEQSEIVVGKRYLSKVNSLEGLSYEVTKITEKTCWVKLWSEGIPTDTIYKDVVIGVLKEME